ncbi:MAG: acylphosphatase [Verrucomicrobiaceae bacterium]|nr:acylphosphatase [Verrucomicrobiaceae bacterium]
MTARQVFYSGHVQGVGFRASVKNLARGFEVTGVVRNLPDGRVELNAQSFEDEEVEAFLQAIDDSDLGSLIKEKEIHPIKPLTNVHGFTIARGDDV